MRSLLPYMPASMMLAVLVGSSLATELQRPSLAVPGDLQGRYGLIGVRVEAAGDTAVVVASTIFPSPAVRAGLRRGDLILGADQYRISKPKDLSRYVQSLDPGSEVSLLVERSETSRSPASQRFTVQCRVTDVKDLYSLMNEHGTESPALGRPRHKRWLAASDSLENTAIRFVDRAAHAQSLQDLQRALVLEGERYGADLRLADVQLALMHPLKIAGMTFELSHDITRFAELSDYLRLAANRLDLDTTDSAMDTDHLTLPDTEMLSDAQLSPALRRDLLTPFAIASAQLEVAFDDLSVDERRLLLRQIPTLLTEFTRARSLDQGDSTETAMHAATLRLAKRVEVSGLVRAAAALAVVTQPKALKRIRRAVRSMSGKNDVAALPSTFGGEFLFARDSERGWVLIGGEGDNIYGGDAAIIVDLGGDDIYLNNCGAPVFIAADGELTSEQQSAVGLLIDFDGDDEYIGNGWGSMGAAIGGIGFLIDLKGNDSYNGAWLTQGSAFCGVGVLWDQAGDDRYHAQQPAQAAAFFGAGLLLDRSGNDHYAAAEQAQGFGGAAGFGLLHDRRGADRYLADRGAPSSYGSAGVFEGWSQGVGCGFRRWASGGMGVLVDGAGDDLYQAGNFSQGTGYFFGLGMLADLDGDDRYRSSRYSQGTAAHQAVGCLLDINGDDDYFARQAANQGAGWDAAVGIIEDRAGDDRYEGGLLAQGAASMNGVGVLFDWAGKDHYVAGDGQGKGESVEYWGGRQAFNIGMMLDTGGQSDHYVGKRPHLDNTEQVSSKVGLFLDQ